MSEHIKKQLVIMTRQTKELAAIYHNVASRSGISDNEFWIWYAILNLGGEYSQQDICDIWSLPKQTVNSIVSNLIKKDYAFLEAVPGGRNRKVIRLTEAGIDFGKKIVQPTFEAEQRSLGHLSEQERQTFISTLGKFIDLLQEELNEEA